jgi:hypothetical protein
MFTKYLRYLDVSVKYEYVNEYKYKPKYKYKYKYENNYEYEYEYKFSGSADKFARHVTLYLSFPPTASRPVSRKFR